MIIRPVNCSILLFSRKETEMKIKHLNPITWLSAGINTALNRLQQDQAEEEPETPATAPAEEQDTAAIVTVTPADQAAGASSIVQGRFIERSTLAIMTEAARRTEEFRREAESFDDEKAPLAEKLLRAVFTAFAYLVPITLAYFIGQAVGDAFTPPGAQSGYSWYAHFLSIALEMSVPILGFCVSLTFRRAAKDRAQVAICAVCVLLFFAVGIGTAVVQIFMVTQNIGALTPRDQAAVYFRAGAPLFVDLIATLYLAVTGAKSLKRYLADKRAVMDAVRDISGINILLEAQQSQAALNQLQAMMDMEAKQERAATWNELERIQNQAIINQARRNMQGDDEGSSWRRRRY